VSSYLAINAVSAALRRLLWTAYAADTGPVRGLVADEQAIVFDNPTETARNPSRRLSLWLYRITENEHMRNMRVPLESAPDRVRSAPMPLDLSYLVTPFTGSGESDQLLLGKTMQVLHDNAIVYLRDDLDGVAEELRILFGRLPIEEVTRIWEALREPYRLSVCYDVRVVRIDSTRVEPQARVIEASAVLSAGPPAGDSP